MGVFAFNKKALQAKQVGGTAGEQVGDQRLAEGATTELQIGKSLGTLEKPVSPHGRLTKVQLHQVLIGGVQRELVPHRALR